MIHRRARRDKQRARRRKGDLGMGYYVNTTSCDFAVRKENYDKAYRLLCELNAHDEL